MAERNTRGCADDEAARRTARGKGFGDALRRSRFLPASVLVLLVSAAAGVFAWSYIYAFANPYPHSVPVAVVGTAKADHGVFLAGMDKALDMSLVPHRYATYAQARNAVEEQTVFAIFDERPDRAVVLDVSSASGASVAEVLTATAPGVSKAIGVDVVVRDINPSQRGDPRGLAIFYITLAAVVVGFVGSIQLSVHADALGPIERIGFICAYSLLGAFTIAAVVDWLLGALSLPFLQVWLTLALAMYVASALFLMFRALIGRWAILPTWAVIVLIGNPASGGAVSWPLLPPFLRIVGPWLPSGAAIEAIHTEVYFPGHLHSLPFLVLAGWALVATSVFCLTEYRKVRAH
ncbi:ABC transporter permease [Streptomyces sp. NPDC059766]|uniref:ABC transporter permease n=1 Tax=Streptomyces sp. NPDC059766 TaxID=3346940 RepID=UPI0036681EB4